MSEANKRRGGCPLVVVTLAGSVLLFFFAFALGMGEDISESTATLLIFISIGLFVGGIATLFWKREKTPQAQTQDGSQQEEATYSEAEIRRQKRKAYILVFILIILGVIFSYIYSSWIAALLPIALGVIILIWALRRPISKN